MARATTKPDLVEAANEKFDKLWQLIDAMTADEQSANFAFGAEKGKEAHWGRDKNLRDVLVHLYEWHQLLLNWVTTNQIGDPMSFIPVPYNWRTHGQLNVDFWEKHQQTTLKDSMLMLKESHVKVMRTIERFSNDELFMKGSFSWIGASTLGSYCVSNTASHYDWAMKKIRAHNNTYRVKG